MPIQILDLSIKLLTFLRPSLVTATVPPPRVKTEVFAPTSMTPPTFLSVFVNQLPALGLLRYMSVILLKGTSDENLTIPLFHSPQLENTLSVFCFRVSLFGSLMTPLVNLS